MTSAARGTDIHGQVAMIEWSPPPPSSSSPPEPSKQRSWMRWALLILGSLSIIGLAPVIFCLVLIAMGAMTLVTELLSLISGALALVVGGTLIGSWAMLGLFPTRWKTILYGICIGLVVLNACFGLTTWIIIIIERANIQDPLDSSTSLILGRERIIATGFACWVLILLTQIAFLIILVRKTYHTKFDPSIPIHSSAFSATLSPSNSVIPMRTATINHHSSIASLTPSRLSHRPTQSWTSPQTMPISNISAPSLKPQTSLPNFPLLPTGLSNRSTDSISSIEVPQVSPLYPPNPVLNSFPFRDSIIQQSSSPSIFPSSELSSHQSSLSKKHKRNSGILKSLTIRTESTHPRKKPSISSLPTPSFPSSLSPRKKFKSVDESLSSTQTQDTTTIWDEWHAGDYEDHNRIKERVEMSFESVRLEKSESSTGLGSRSKLSNDEYGREDEC